MICTPANNAIIKLFLFAAAVSTTTTVVSAEKKADLSSSFSSSKLRGYNNDNNNNSNREQNNNKHNHRSLQYGGNMICTPHPEGGSVCSFRTDLSASNPVVNAFEKETHLSCFGTDEDNYCIEVDVTGYPGPESSKFQRPIPGGGGSTTTTTTPPIPPTTTTTPPVPPVTTTTTVPPVTTTTAVPPIGDSAIGGSPIGSSFTNVDYRGRCPAGREPESGTFCATAVPPEQTEQSCFYYDGTYQCDCALQDAGNLARWSCRNVGSNDSSSPITGGGGSGVASRPPAVVVSDSDSGSTTQQQQENGTGGGDINAQIQSGGGNNNPAAQNAGSKNEKLGCPLEEPSKGDSCRKSGDSCCYGGVTTCVCKNDLRTGGIEFFCEPSICGVAIDPGTPVNENPYPNQGYVLPPNAQKYAYEELPVNAEAYSYKETP